MYKYMSWSVEGNAKKYDEERARPHLNSIVQLNAKLSSLNNGAKCAQSDDLLTPEALSSKKNKHDRAVSFMFFRNNSVEL